MSDTINQTREQSIAAQPFAVRVIGSGGRLAWQWDGKCYTSTGVHVPADIIREDDALILDGVPLPPDEEVLDMVVSLPHEALPPGAFLTPLDGSQPSRPAKEDPRDARIKELEAKIEAAKHPQPPQPKDAIDEVLSGTKHPPVKK